MCAIFGPGSRRVNWNQPHLLSIWNWLTGLEPNRTVARTKDSQEEDTHTHIPHTTKHIQLLFTPFYLIMYYNALVQAPTHYKNVKSRSSNSIMIISNKYYT